MKRDGLSVEAAIVRDVFDLAGELLRPVELPHRDPAHAQRMIDLAFARIDDWSCLADPKLHLSTKGGSSPSNEEEDEQSERARVARMALRARDDLPMALAQWLTHGQRLADDLRRFTHTVDASKLPKDDAARFCTNCKKAGYLWAETYDRAPGSGLCRWCWERRGAVAGDQTPPPLEAVRLHHEGRHREAARWLADAKRKHDARKDVS